MYSDASVIITVRIFDLGLKDLIEKFNEVMLSLGCKDQDYEIFEKSGPILLYYKYKSKKWYSNEIDPIKEDTNYVKYILIDKAISAIMDSEYKGKIRIVKSFDDGIILNVYKEEGQMEPMCCKDCPRIKEATGDKKEESIINWVRKFIEGNPWYGALRHDYGYELCSINERKTPFGDGIVSIGFDHPDKTRILAIIYLDDYGAVNNVRVSLCNVYDLDAIEAIGHLLGGLRDLWPKD